MTGHELLASWFRQQSELSMPDLILTRELSSKLVQGAVASSKRTSTGIAAPSDGPAVSMKKSSSAPVKNPTSLKSRLSGLRPVDELVAMARNAEAAVTTPAGASVVAAVDSGKREALKVLFRNGCTQCHLAQTRTNFIFGAGNADAPVMVIGEAPGRDEDEQGLPFVGAAGQLLTGMLSAIKLDRNRDVFITNILKCRPPGNRNPESAEIVTCLPLLRQQITIIAPAAILLLGRIAAHALLDINDSIAKMRGKVFSYQGVSTMVIYHPAALLRNAHYKRPAWEDLQKFQQLLASSGIYGSLYEK